MGNERGLNFATPSKLRTADDRLGSWKEIAAYLKSGVRTVQRWEKLEELPVHRHVHKKLGSVYAYKSEIAAWEAQRRMVHPSPTVSGQGTGTQQVHQVSPVSIGVASAGVPSIRSLGSEAPKAKGNRAVSSTVSQPAVESDSRRMVTGGLVLALAAGVGGMFLTRSAHRSEAKRQNGRVMLAVLPFANLSGDPAQEYFSDGVTERMITELGRINPSRLGVIPHTSSVKYKHGTEDTAQISRELGVQYILEGSVRRSAKEVLISVRLIQASDQAPLWSQDYRRRPSDPFSIQGQVAQAVSDEISIRLSLTSRPRRNPSLTPP